jgi:hypothetical protein
MIVRVDNTTHTQQPRALIIACARSTEVQGGPEEQASGNETAPRVTEKKEKWLKVPVPDCLVGPHAEVVHMTHARARGVAVVGPRGAYETTCAAGGGYETRRPVPMSLGGHGVMFVIIISTFVVMVVLSRFELP